MHTRSPRRRQSYVEPLSVHTLYKLDLVSGPQIIIFNFFSSKSIYVHFPITQFLKNYFLNIMCVIKLPWLNQQSLIYGEFCNKLCRKQSKELKLLFSRPSVFSRQTVSLTIGSRHIASALCADVNPRGDGRCVCAFCRYGDTCRYVVQ